MFRRPLEKNVFNVSGPFRVPQKNRHISSPPPAFFSINLNNEIKTIFCLKKNPVKCKPSWALSASPISPLTFLKYQKPAPGMLRLLRNSIVLKGPKYTSSILLKKVILITDKGVSKALFLWKINVHMMSSDDVYQYKQTKKMSESNSFILRLIWEFISIKDIIEGKSWKKHFDFFILLSCEKYILFLFACYLLGSLNTDSYLCKASFSLHFQLNIKKDFLSIKKRTFIKVFVPNEVTVWWKWLLLITDHNDLKLSVLIVKANLTDVKLKEKQLSVVPLTQLKSTLTQPYSTQM